jgi:transposase-like protein
MQKKVSGLRKRRQHSEEFRARVVAACQEPGVSVAAVALANGLNANLVRRWIKERVERLPVRRQSAVGSILEPMTVVPVRIESGEGKGGEEIRIDIRRGGIAVQMAWPATRADELGRLLGDLLR